MMNKATEALAKLAGIVDSSESRVEMLRLGVEVKAHLRRWQAMAPTTEERLKLPDGMVAVDTMLHLIVRKEKRVATNQTSDDFDMSDTWQWLESTIDDAASAMTSMTSEEL